MKKRITLLETDGYAPNSNCRRDRVEGRLELLTAFFDGPPFWFVRIRNLQDDEAYLKTAIGLPRLGNGHFRYVSRLAAEKQFERLLALPRYAKEARKARELAEKRRDTLKTRVLAGKMRSFARTAAPAE